MNGYRATSDRYVIAPRLVQHSELYATIVTAQIENDVDADTVFESKTGARRSSASTNNNNQSPVEPGSPKTVRSR